MDEDGPVDGTEDGEEPGLDYYLWLIVMEQNDDTVKGILEGRSANGN